MPGPHLTCALFSASPWDWAAAVALTSEGVDFSALPAAEVGLPEDLNPFGLPQETDVDVALICTSWLRWVSAHAPGELDPALEAIARRARVMAALDGSDGFSLGIPQEVIERVALVLKCQGVYRDRDLYNYEVGTEYPGGNWTEKARARSRRYREADLEKLRLSVPCFIADLPGLRAAAREREAHVGTTAGRAPSRAERVLRNAAERTMWPLVSLASLGRRPDEVQCVVSLTHVQRVQAMQLLDGYSGSHGLLRRWPDGLPGSDEAALLAAAEPFFREPVGRIRHLRDMRRHRVVFAPTGYGELTYRHAEALRAGAALVCQDLSHVQTMFEFRDGRNAVFCRPDLSDLREVVGALLGDEMRRRRIARSGRTEFAAWSRAWRDHVEAGIGAPLRRAV